MYAHCSRLAIWATARTPGTESFRARTALVRRQNGDQAFRGGFRRDRTLRKPPDTGRGADARAEVKPGGGN